MDKIDNKQAEIPKKNKKALYKVIDSILKTN